MRHLMKPRPQRMRFTRSAAAIALTVSLLAPSLARAGRNVCDGPIQHPLGVRVVALDPVRRGEPVRLRVETSSRSALTAADVSVANDGGARVLGARHAKLGALAPGRARSADFQVRVPASGRQFLVQFTIHGEGPQGPVSRGAVYNLLPDGPEQARRVVPTAGGEQVAEFAAKAVSR